MAGILRGEQSGVEHSAIFNWDNQDPEYFRAIQDELAKFNPGETLSEQVKTDSGLSDAADAIGAAFAAMTTELMNGPAQM